MKIKFLFLGFFHLLIYTCNGFFKLLMSIRSETWHRLNLVRVYRVLLKFCENKTHGILEPKSLSFNANSSLKLFIMLDSILDFSSRIHTLPFYGIDEIVRTLITKSHRSKWIYEAKKVKSLSKRYSLSLDNLLTWN